MHRHSASRLFASSLLAPRGVAQGLIVIVTGDGFASAQANVCPLIANAAL
jgi:hypothetical protein